VERVSGTPWQGKIGNNDTKWSLGENFFNDNDAGLAQSSDLGFTGGLFSGKRHGIGFDTQFRLGPVEVWGEFLKDHFEPRDQIPLSKLDSEGWYVLGAYRMLHDRLMLVLKYETFDPNIDRSGNTTGTWTIGANWFFKGDDLCFRFNYLRTDNPSLPDKQNKILVRFQVVF